MKIPVTNSGRTAMYVGAAMIPAGETRHFEEAEVPHHLRPKPDVTEEPAAPADKIADLSKKPAREIIEQIAQLSNEQLDRLSALEQAKGSKARSSLLSAIAEAVLQRAEGASGGA